MDSIFNFVAKLAEYAVKPIGRQLGYLVFYNNNINDLRGQRSDLVNAIKRLQHEVEQEKNKGNEIEADVSVWLGDANTIINSTDIEGSSPSCFNLVQRHKLGRKAKKKVLEISEMIEKRKMFHKVGYLTPLPSIAISHITGHQILESRTSKAKEIKDALADPNINRVGVYGMGGVGKTRLLKDVEKLVRENNMFDHVVNVTVGQTFSVESIQDQIADKLRLKYKQVRTNQGKADLLRNKLKMEKKVLIMLDDVWKDVNLEDVGILCRSETSQEGCKLLVTSREKLTNHMFIEKFFNVNPLSEEESRTLFMALFDEGGRIEHEVKEVAMEVAKECAGLPIALDAVAKALKGKQLPCWKDALMKLKNNIAVNIKGVSDKVYSSLKLSYDFIKDEETKSLFLLCSVFPDDYEIFVEDLQMYAMGMRLLEDVSTWNDARNRVCALVDDLKSSSLLLETDSGDEYVKMHDVVRDVAIYIASKEANMPTLSHGYQRSEWQEKYRSGSYKAIFGDCDSFHNLPQNFEFKQLELLILKRNEEEKLQISDTFFEGMKELKVLVLRTMIVEKFSTSFTYSLQNLRIFCMSSCKVDDIDAIGHLKKLEILKIRYCPITCLPATMSGLTELKVLRVSSCHDLKVIPQNVLSSMTNLEELDLWESFKEWGKEVLYKNKLIKNAPLVELKCLPHLICLRINIFDYMSLPDLMFLKKLKLEIFSISVGSIDLEEEYDYARTLALEIKSQSDLIDRVLGSLLLRCGTLILKAAVGVTNLGDYGLSQCDNRGNATPFFHSEVAFPWLKHLEIRKGNSLKMLWHNNRMISHSFTKLKIIKIIGCNRLRCILPTTVVMSLVSLERLKVEECHLLEMIFEIENPTFKKKDDAIIVPLIELYLRRLRNLKYVWSKDPNDFLTFSNLQDVYINGCPQLKSVFPASFVSHLQQMTLLRLYGIHQIFGEDTTSKSMSPQIVYPNLFLLGCSITTMMRSFCFTLEAFPRLTFLRLDGSLDDHMVSLPLKINQMLDNIEGLLVSNSQLVQIFFNEENNQIKKYANLKYLTLSSLPELTHMWKGNTQKTILSDNLESIEIKRCSKLKCLVPPSTTFLNLRHLSIWHCNELMNLLSSSVAKSLVKLEEMRIFHCQGMTSILAKGEGEKENDEIVFNKLVELEVFGLPRIDNFYVGKCMLKFPCLKKLIIKRCPEMKIFSHEIVYTPKLPYLKTEDGEVVVSPHYDINVIIHNLWLEKNHKKDQTYDAIKQLFTQENEEKDYV